MCKLHGSGFLLSGPRDMAKKKSNFKPMNIQKAEKNGSFWTINLGHVITLVAYLLTGAYYIGQTRSELIAIKTNISTIDQSVTRIDREGSMYLRGLENNNNRELGTHDRRLEKLEELIPKLANIDGTLTGIKNDLSYLKEHIDKKP